MDTVILLTAKDVALILKVSKSLAYRLVSQGQIDGVRFGRTVRIKPESLDKFIEKNLTNNESSHGIHSIQ
jgi:excisionase family DNA binding protein